MQGVFNVCRSINVTYHINKKKDNHMIISIDTEKLDKIQILSKFLELLIRGVSAKISHPKFSTTSEMLTDSSEGHDAKA